MTTWNRDDSDLTTVLGLNSTTVGNIRITGNTIGHSSDTDILTFAETTLDITSPNVDINGNLAIKNSAGDTTYVTLSSAGISGTLTTAAQPNITTVGTISTGVWNATALTASKVPNHDNLNGFVANEHIDWTTDQGSTNINVNNVPWATGNPFDNDNAGIVPNPGSTGTTTKYLREDGTFQIPPDTNTQLSTEQVQDIVGSMFSSNTETRITATYQDGDGTIDLVVDDLNTDTTYTGGTNLTLAGTTFNVDDAFLINSGDDTTSGVITAGGFTTTGTWTFDTSAGGTTGITNVNIGSAFTDNDTTIMSAAAIKNKIESYSYSTTTGTITSVEVTTDSGSGARFNQNTGAASFSILGTSGVNVTNSSGTVTVTSVPSEIDHNSLDNYTSTEHFTQANIVTVGTIATGVWEGTAIADAYISSASTWNAKQPQLTFGLSSGNTLRTEEAIAENDILLGGSTHVKGRTYAELKSDLSLNNVENTALSTFAGTSNITTLGTITTGTWNGTAINQTYLEGQSGTNTGDQTKASFDLDHLYTLVGAASDDAEHLSTFTGSTIADNQTIKQALQALETAVESAGGASSLNGLSDVTFSSNDLTIPGLDKIIFDGAVDYDLSGNVTFTENGASFSFLTLDYDSETLELKGNSGNTTLSAQIFTTSSTGRLRCDDVLRLESGIVDVSNPNIEFGSAGGVFGFGMVSGTFTSYIEYNVTSNTYKYMNSSDRDDYYQMTVGSHGATTLATVCDSGDNAANLTLDVDGDIELNADGGNITFKDASTSLAEISGSGILSKSVIYFDAETANTIGDGATGAIDWTTNQKQKVTITGTGITCNFTNPPGPCNLTLKVVQGDGSDVIGTWDSDIKWAGGGTAPTLSTANGAIDILSFYFDGTNYFGVASTNFS